MGYQAHFLYVLIHEMRHGVESIHNHAQLQSFYNNTGQPRTVHLQKCSTFPSKNTLCLTNSKIVYCLVCLFLFCLVFC